MYRQSFRSGPPQRSSGSRGPSRGGFRSPSRRPSFKGAHIDISKLISKAVITEEVEHFVPEHAFSDFKIEEILKNKVITKGYITPTPIQDRAIPHVLRGSDVVGIANTGTGKTAAFLIPLINKVLLNPRENVLVVVPTRELAIQIEDELKTFTQGLKIFSVCCVGGAPIGRQMSMLRYHNNFIIGTPGRLKDLIERKMINLNTFNTIVLDEADRMLDMGFVNDMRFMMAKMPAVRHTLFFSATLSKEIEVLIKDFLKEPIRISVKTQDTSKNVDQDVVRVGKGTKLEVLHNLLAQSSFSKVLIFGRTKHGVEKLTQDLVKRGLKAESIHGDKNHSGRQRALKLFKENHVQILVATDVAARGLDIDGVSHVINYDMPGSYEDYVHRIGRTGRGNKKGTALTFID
jgi:ATP-dependent RNA helicase RhlE